VGPFVFLEQNMKKLFILLFLAALAVLFLIHQAEASSNGATAYGVCAYVDNSTIDCSASEADNIIAYVYVTFDNATSVDVTYKIIPSCETAAATIADTNPVTSPIEYIAYTRRITATVPSLAVELPIDKYRGKPESLCSPPKTRLSFTRNATGGRASIKVRGAIKR